jgi:hypothetical protein
MASIYLTHYRTNFPPEVDKTSSKLCLECKTSYKKVAIIGNESTYDLSGFADPITLDQKPFEVKETNLGSGFFKEVDCIPNCPKGKFFYLTTSMCTNCPDRKNCLACNYPLTKKLNSWIGRVHSNSCAVCNKYSLKYGKGISVHS